MTPALSAIWLMIAIREEKKYWKYETYQAMSGEEKEVNFASELASFDTDSMGWLNEIIEFNFVSMVA